MKNLKAYIIIPASTILLWICLLSPFQVKAAGEQIAVIKDGVIDLSDYDFDKHGNILLSGKWKFFREKFYNSEQAKNDNGYAFLDVPKNWKDQDYHGELLPAHGYGTYYLRIIVGKNHRNRFFLLRTRYIPNASRIYLNDKLIGHGGNPGETSETTEASLTVTLNEFDFNTDTLDLIIQASNFHLGKGGMYYEVELGDAKSINKSNAIKEIKIFFIIGSVFLMILYYLILFLLRKKEKSSLFFSIVCLCNAIYTLCLSDLYYYFFPF
ncbi:MAG: 7TM diverse intracellular signaling domain-containing protein, partial [Bacteroidota bacterium]